MTYKEQLISDINEISKLAIANEEFNVALKAKELIAKLTCANKGKDGKLDLNSLTNEELEGIIKTLEAEL